MAADIEVGRVITIEQARRLNPNDLGDYTTNTDFFSSNELDALKLRIAYIVSKNSDNMPETEKRLLNDLKHTLDLLVLVNDSYALKKKEYFEAVDRGEIE